MTHIRLHSVDLDLPVGRFPFLGGGKQASGRTSDPRIDRSRGNHFVRVLNDVTLEFKQGERVGLIGVNGAGKSTFLRVLAGIYAPTRGVCDTEGRISTLFSSTIGMNPQASGRENIYLSGRTLGMSRAEIRAAQDDIISFADIGEFIDMPLRLYSAGMKTRLGFAIATTITPEILLIDEVFGVGDAAFQQRAQERIQQVVGKAGILVLASHSDSMISQFCDKVCCIEKGAVQFFGPSKEGLEIYRNAIQQHKTTA